MFRYIYIDQGSTFRATYKTDQLLFGATVSGSLKKHYQQELPSLTFSATIDDEGTGTVTISLTPEQTDTLKADTTYVYDVVAEYTNGDKVRFLEGNAVIKGGVTR